MPKRPRRTIVEHRKIVELARIRRNNKENENQRFIEKYGVVNMSNQQNLLMASGMPTECNYTGAVHEVARDGVMDAIIVTVCITPVVPDVMNLGCNDDHPPLLVENLPV